MDTNNKRVSKGAPSVSNQAPENATERRPAAWSQKTFLRKARAGKASFLKRACGNCGQQMVMPRSNLTCLNCGFSR